MFWSKIPKSCFFHQEVPQTNEIDVQLFPIKEIRTELHQSEPKGRVRYFSGIYLFTVQPCPAPGGHHSHYEKECPQTERERRATVSRY